MEVTTTFQIELLSGGVFWVYAVYPQNSAFLIWKDDCWVWMEADMCKPYVLPWMGSAYPGGVTQDETTKIIDGCCTACGELMDCCEAAEYKFCPYCAKRIV